jgi:predicted nucleic acid-binding protein
MEKKMGTDLAIDDDLIEEARRIDGHSTKKQAVTVRQEVLSRIAMPEQFAEVKTRLDPFPDQPIGSEDYIEAARLDNLCRRRGVECGAVDMLLCALAYRNEWTILARDGGMERSIAAIEAETGKRLAEIPPSRVS